MQRGDVLQLFTDGTSSKNQWAGSRVTATHPVQVISGAPCANVPDDTVACDHLEEFVPPTDVLGRDYLVATPVTPSGNRRHLVRLFAVEDNTAVTFEPPEVHNSVNLSSGESLELDISEDFGVASTKPIGISQFLLGHGGGSSPTQGPGVGDGDPSQSTCVARSRYLKSYVFATPPGFVGVMLNVIAPSGATVRLNGLATESSAFDPIGSTGFSVARLPIDPATRYEVSADQPFGAQLYGYGPFTSFMVPLGLDLRATPAP
jgi:hypothetical protein